MARSTADLMAARFGMAGYGTAQLGELFTLLRGLRVAAGDFRAEPEPGAPVLSARRPQGMGDSRQ